MKILREKSREYKGKLYYKYKINIPEKVLEDAGFVDGDILKADSKKGEIKISKKSKEI